MAGSRPGDLPCLARPPRPGVAPVASLQPARPRRVPLVKSQLTRVDRPRGQFSGGRPRPTRLDCRAACGVTLLLVHRATKMEMNVCSEMPRDTIPPRFTVALGRRGQDCTDSVPNWPVDVFANSFVTHLRQIWSAFRPPRAATERKMSTWCWPGVCEERNNPPVGRRALAGRERI